MRVYKLLPAVLGIAIAFGAFADDKSVDAEAKRVAAKIAEIAKAKGVAGAVDAVNNSELCMAHKDKGLTCGVYSADYKVIANPLRPALVGQVMKDLLDPDGKNISDLMLGPIKDSSKNSWEGEFKFNAPGSKAIGLRKTYCNRLDAATAACVGFPKA